MTDPAEYVRQVEAYLCQKNRGHLIRVVGPAFELVRGWATGGVPLRVAFRGIDRCCQRREARGGARRPLRIEFCADDVLEAFHEWRRAVGLPALSAAKGEEAEAPARKPALTAHIERATARLAFGRGAGAPESTLHERIDEIIRELERMAAEAPRARGEVRAAVSARLAALDAVLMRAALAGLDPGTASSLKKEAAGELAAFGSRMPPDARERATEAAFERLVRERLGLPTLTYDL